MKRKTTDSPMTDAAEARRNTTANGAQQAFTDTKEERNYKLLTGYFPSPLWTLDLARRIIGRSAMRDGDFILGHRWPGHCRMAVPDLDYIAIRVWSDDIGVYRVNFRSQRIYSELEGRNTLLSIKAMNTVFKEQPTYQAPCANITALIGEYIHSGARRLLEADPTYESRTMDAILYGF